MEKSPPPHPPISDPGRGLEGSPREEELEPAGPPQEPAETDEATDPYDELWDPDMDTRPERIRKTKARSRTDSRPKGGPPPRGRRREGA